MRSAHLKVTVSLCFSCFGAVSLPTELLTATPLPLSSQLGAGGAESVGVFPESGVKSPAADADG